MLDTLLYCLPDADVYTHSCLKGFLELPSDTFHAAKDFEISLKFQTDQLNGLLLFIHNTEGPDFLAVS
jgi:hypothetical protein